MILKTLLVTICLSGAAAATATSAAYISQSTPEQQKACNVQYSNRWVYFSSRCACIAAVSSFLKPQPTFTMASTVDWTEEMSSEFQTERYSSEDHATILSELDSPGQSSTLPQTIANGCIGVLGIVACGLVLAGFWLSDRSKLTQSSTLIINHTTLDLLMS